MYIVKPLKEDLEINQNSFTFVTKFYFTLKWDKGYMQYTDNEPNMYDIINEDPSNIKTLFSALSLQVTMAGSAWTG